MESNYEPRLPDEEREYWEDTARKVTVDGGIVANFFKIGQIVRRLLKYSFWGKNVLEIGAGLGLVAVNLRNLQDFHYTGCEISEVYCERNAEDRRLDMVQTDITNLPADDGTVNFLLALDVMEHVNPDLRMAGFREIGRVMKSGGLVIINNPCDENRSGHPDEYEYGFDLKDLQMLKELAGLRLLSLETYGILVKSPLLKKKKGDFRKYEWTVLQRK